MASIGSFGSGGSVALPFLVAPAPSGDTTGTTDNVALQATLNALPATGGTVILQGGTYYLTNVSTSRPTRIIGQGAPERKTLHGGTLVISKSTNLPAITNGFAPFNCSNFGLINQASSTPVSGSAGILCSAANTADSMRIENVLIRGFYINLDVVNGLEWFLLNNTIYDFVQYGMRINDTLIPDGGDMYCAGNLIITGPTNVGALAHVRYESGGGMRFIGNKINAYTNASPANNVGFEAAFTDGITTGDLQIIGNSIENTGTNGSAIYVHGKGPSNTATFNNIIIFGNQIATSHVAIQVAGAATNLFRNVQVFGNTMFSCDFAYVTANITTGRFGPDVQFSIANPPIWGTGSTNLLHGDNPKALGSQTIGVAQSAIAHGLGYVPTQVLIVPTTSPTTGSVWRSAASDATNVFLTATAAEITCDVFVL